MKLAALALARRALPLVALGLALSTQAQTPAKNDYPTLDRVIYVQNCLNDHPGPNYEMLSKCVCVIDKIASQVKHDEYETMITATNAFSIGGERGGYIRDTEVLTDKIKQFRELQTAAKKSCFINSGPR